MVKKLAVMLLVCLCLVACGKEEKEPEVTAEPVVEEEVLETGTLNFYGETYTYEENKVCQISNNGLDVEDAEGNSFKVFLMSSSNFKVWSKAVSKDLAKLVKKDDGYALDTEGMHAYIKDLGNCYIVFLSENLTSDILATK